MVATLSRDGVILIILSRDGVILIILFPIYSQLVKSKFLSDYSSVELFNKTSRAHLHHEDFAA